MGGFFHVMGAAIQECEYREKPVAERISVC
jgi:hypothetical protein